MFVVEIVLVGVMGLLFLWLGLSMMFEKPDSTGFISAFVAAFLIPLLGLVIVAAVFISGLYTYNHADDDILAELLKEDRSSYYLEFENEGTFRFEVYYLDPKLGKTLIGENAMRRQTYQTYFDDSLKVDKELLQKLVHERLSDNKLPEELDVNSAEEISLINFLEENQ